jgi:hypothetical protein
LKALEGFDHDVRSAEGAVEVGRGDIEEPGGRTHDDEGEHEGESGSDEGLEAALRVEGTLLADVPLRGGDVSL